MTKWIETELRWGDEVLDVQHTLSRGAVPMGVDADALPPGVTLTMRSVEAVQERVPRHSKDWGALPFVAASMAFAGVFLVLASLAPPPSNTLSLLDADRIQRFVSAHTVAPVATPQTQGAHDEEGIECGALGQRGEFEAPQREPTRATRPEPNAAPSARASTRPAGVGRATRPALRMPNPVLPVAAPSPFDADRALRETAGAITGATELGANFGFGGLAMVGTGRHAGGEGLGTLTRHEPMGLRGSFGAACGCVEGLLADGYGVAGLGTLRGRAEERSSGVPTLRGGRPQVQGQLDPSVIRRVVRRQMDAVRHCYERALQSQPQLAGRVLVDFRIDESGQVFGARVQESSVQHQEMEACVLGIAQRYRFPAAAGSQSHVTYPFVFTSAD